MLRSLPLLSGLLAASLAAQDPGAALRAWLTDYKAGAVRFQKDGLTDHELVAAADRTMAAVAARDTMADGRLLFEVATVRPASPADPAGAVAFQREVQPWRVRAMAQRHLRGMRAPDLLPWLLKKLRAKGLRAKEENDDQRHARAVLKVLAGHPSLEAKLELMRACGAMPNELRVHAVNAMADDAELDLVPTLLELLKDREPNVRIARPATCSSNVTSRSRRSQRS